MSEFWTSALQSAGSHLSAGWFWLFPLLFLIHDAEEAAYVWMKGSLHNSISYTTLNVTQTLVAISFELTIFMAAAAWAAEPGAPRLAIFILGGTRTRILSVSQQRCRLSYSVACSSTPNSSNPGC